MRWLRRNNENGTSILVRSLTYRVAVIVADALLLLVIFRDALEAGMLTVIRHAVQTVLFAAHAYMWDHIAWGIGLSGRSTRTRSLVKAGLFRMIAVVNDMVILTQIAHQDLPEATLTTMAIAATNTAIFYLHDRVFTPKASVRRR